jgi:hypothetical protein
VDRKVSDGGAAAGVDRGSADASPESSLYIWAVTFACSVVWQSVVLKDGRGSCCGRTQFCQEIGCPLRSAFSNNMDAVCGADVWKAFSREITLIMGVSLRNENDG